MHDITCITYIPIVNIVLDEYNYLHFYRNYTDKN